jgi:hypothetical protein
MLRLRSVVAVAALIALAVAPAASAHQGNPNYRSVIEGVTPQVSGVRLQILNLDDRLELQNDSGKTVVVQGYNGEPYARVLGDGTVQVNRRSPAFYLNDDRFARVKVPVSAKQDATPQWQVVDKAGRFEWHDHRIHWMSDVPPKQVTDRSKRTKVFDWKVPVQVGAQRGAVTGTLFWQPTAGGGAPVGAMAGLGAIALLGLAAVVVVVVRRRRAGADGAAGAPRAEVEAW